MSRLTPFAPDPLPLRDALRGMRHALRQGRAALERGMLAGPLPKPAAAFTRVVLREVDHLAEGAEDLASGLARQMLGQPADGALRLDAIEALPDASHRFAAATYAALRASLTRLGAAEAYISEAAALQAHEALVEDAAGDSLPQVAARLARLLLAEGVVRDLDLAPGHAVAPATLTQLAVFATMLWLVTERSEADSAAALAAATDLALALQAEVLAAFAATGEARLAALFDELRDHV